MGQSVLYTKILFSTIYDIRNDHRKKKSFYVISSEIRRLTLD